MGGVCSEGRATRKDEAVEEEAMQSAGGRYTVLIDSARGLRDVDWFPGEGASDCYVKFREDGGDQLHETSVVKDCLDPLWQEEVDFDHAEGNALEFTLWDKDDIGKDVALGKVMVDAMDFEVTGVNKDFKVVGEGSGQKPAYLKIKIKKAKHSEYPPGPKGEVSITLEKGDFKSYGLDLDTQIDSMLLVTTVKAGGAAEKFNEDAPPEQQLLRNDFIVSVNGETGVKAMLVQFRGQPALEVVFRRPTVRTICLERPEKTKPIGLKFASKPMANYLAVRSIDDGVFKDYNETVKDKDQLVRVDDYIVSCNGETTPAKQLEQKLNEAKGKFKVDVISPWEDSRPSFWFF